jgi:hypothetical protein
MRLINTECLRLEEYIDNNIPPYAILSHTWEDEEVTLQDWSDLETRSSKKGYTKIRDTCAQALKDGYRYVWVDTNCIDKTSSAELSEAINSMFEWYHKAEVCYAYLVDIETTPDMPLEGDLGRCRWFSRGWTLQELLAPERVLFYARGWSFIGSKATLRYHISKITSIDERFLAYEPSKQKTLHNSRLPSNTPDFISALHQASVAEKMSWLANRATTRAEDMAYCMLGIFEINMPLLYGEGQKAFLRLQEEILKVSEDHTIFCWFPTDGEEGNDGDIMSCLSPKPQYFGRSRAYRPLRHDDEPTPYSMTNVGLLMNLPIVYTALANIFIAIIEVYSLETGTENWVGIPLKGDLKSRKFYRSSFPRIPILLARGTENQPREKMFMQTKINVPVEIRGYSRRLRYMLNAIGGYGRQNEQGPFILLTFERRISAEVSQLQHNNHSSGHGSPVELFDATIRLDNGAVHICTVKTPTPGVFAEFSFDGQDTPSSILLAASPEPPFLLHYTAIEPHEFHAPGRLANRNGQLPNIIKKYSTMCWQTDNDGVVEADLLLRTAGLAITTSPIVPDPSVGLPPCSIHVHITKLE